MKQFVKRMACGVLAIAMIGILVGCSREAPSTTASSDRAPVGYKAIAAMNASAAEKADRSVRTMSREDKIGQLMFISLQGTTFDESQKELIRLQQSLHPDAVSDNRTEYRDNHRYPDYRDYQIKISHAPQKMLLVNENGLSKCSANYSIPVD